MSRMGVGCCRVGGESALAAPLQRVKEMERTIIDRDVLVNSDGYKHEGEWVGRYKEVDMGARERRESEAWFRGGGGREGSGGR